MTDDRDTPVLVDDVGGVFTITLNRPSTRHALGSAMLNALEIAVNLAHASARDGRTQVTIIRSTGSVFCAGFDLSECVKDRKALERFITQLADLAQAIRAMPAVVIAQVQGPALAGGCALVGACDMVCASESASFGYPVHRIGVSSAVSLPTLMASAGFGAARLLSLSGEIVDAQRARTLGLVYLIAPDTLALTSMVSELAARLAIKPPEALRVTKQWLNKVDGTAVDGFLGRRACDATRATIQLCEGEELRRRLEEFWTTRKDRG